MRVLLDSHYLLWLAADRAELKAREKKFLAEADVVIPAIAIWELRLKWDSLDSSGKRKLDYDPSYLLDVIEQMSWPIAALDGKIAAAPLRHPIAHKDPFDTLLLVQAQEMGIKLLSRDDKLIGHPLVFRAE